MDPTKLQHELEEAASEALGPKRGAAGLAKQHERWKKLREQYLALDEEHRKLDVSLSVKYGKMSWASKAEQKKVAALRARMDKVADKLIQILDAVSPRNWHSGVPAHWIYRSLSWEDAIRPLNQPLSVTPPLSYGSTVPMR